MALFAPRGEAPDSLAVYGPRRFEAGPGGGAAVHVERFRVAHPDGRYWVRVVRDGAAQATVRLNGAVLFSASDFAQAGTIGVPVVLAAENTLEAEVRGQAGAGITLAVLREVDASYALMPPRRFTRAAGATAAETVRFEVPVGAAGPFRVHVLNGAPDGTQRVSSAEIRLDGVLVAGPSELGQRIGGFVRDAQLVAGRTAELAVETRGAPGGLLTVWVTATDVAAPVLAIDAPAAGLITRGMEVAVSGWVRDQTPVRVTINGAEATRSGDAFSATVVLGAEGENRLVFSAVDGAGLRTDSVRAVIRDSEAPVVTLAHPGEGAMTRDSAVRMRGTIQDRTAVSANVNGTPVSLDADGSFEVELALAEGPNFLTVTATDAAGNSGTAVRRVTRDTQPPVITLTSPAEGLETEQDTVAVQGSATDLAPPTVKVNGLEVPISPTGTFGYAVALQPGVNSITVSATDALGNSASVSRTVTRRSDDLDLPPDPARVASAIDPTIATDLGEATRFLYTGTRPIQTGVAPGAIHPVRAAVVRGRVLTRDGAPLSGAVVSVLGRPELGQTLSRADGMYDLAVNGGGVLTVQLAKPGFIAAQRQAHVSWQSYARVEDVILVAYDPAVTVVTLTASTAEAQVARGSVVRDEDGSRQATVVIDPGTEAVIELPGGEARPVGALSLRATEFTVGPRGRASMPAPLPATSGYTYAAELSADEAVQAGARHIRFSKPVSFYIENFLGFPVGTLVPVATYEYSRAAWVPGDNGRVVRVVDTAGGVASVDVDGDGAPESTQALAALGFSTAELVKLAEGYAPGATLWRAEMTHFSPVDLNHPVTVQRPAVPPLPPRPDEDSCNQEGGSVIECESQVLGESVSLPGTPFTINYRSDRVPGRAPHIQIPLTGDSLGGLVGVELEIEVAGRQFKERFAPARNLSYRFTWDGLDAYGRRVQGPQKVRVRRGYIVPQRYLIPAQVARSFGLACDRDPGPNDFIATCTIPVEMADSARQYGTYWDDNAATYGGEYLVSQWDARGMGFGGWTLDVHHAYDRRSRTLLMGGGERRSGATSMATIRTIAGDGVSGFRGDGGPATAARFQNTSGIAVAPDGSIYVAEYYGHRVRRIGPDGVITTVAGTGTCGLSGDGGPATAAQLCTPESPAVGPDGSLYIPEEFNNRVRRIDPDGVITTVAGSGPRGWSAGTFSGDGGPATQATLSGPTAVAVGDDGTLYIADTNNMRVRRVGPDGTIHTLAGNGQRCANMSAPTGACGDGGPATAAQLSWFWSVAVGPDGSVYFADANNHRVRRVAPDGRITTVAGNGVTCIYTPNGPTYVCGDGGPATRASLSWPGGVAVGRDGSVYIADSNTGRVRVVRPDGVLVSIAGTSQRSARFGDNGPALGSTVDAGELALSPDGGLLVTSFWSHRIRRISAPLPGTGAGDMMVSSPDGTEVYHFDYRGRHLRTVDAVTGAPVYRFDYDDAGRLAAVVDGYGATTRIERGASGGTVAIVGSDGERTLLSMDDAGFLGDVTSSDGRTIRLTYHAEGGLLGSLTDVRGAVNRYTYDPLGRLVVDEDALGGRKVLAGERSQECVPTDGVPVCEWIDRVRVTTAGSRTTTYETRMLASGGVQSSIINPAGLRTTTESRADGTHVTRSADGMVTTRGTSGDPRWGLGAAGTGTVEVVSRLGLRSTIRTVRRATLANPENPFSLTGQVDSVWVNGNATVSAYDAALRRLTRTTAEGRSTTVRTDAAGRPSRVEEPGVEPVQVTYDARGNPLLMEQGTRRWSSTYTSDGQIASTTDPMGRTERFGYDALGRLVRRTHPDGREVGYGYDATGNLTHITPPGRAAHRFSYTARGQLESYDPPSAAAGTRYAYNLDGQLTRVTRPDGSRTDVAHDAGGRLAKVSFRGGHVAYAYDPSRGTLSSVETAEGQRLSFEFDGSLPLSLRSEGTVAGTVAFQYDNAFRISADAVNGTHGAAYRYDRDGLLLQAGDMSLARDPLTGRVTGTTLGGARSALAFDRYGELARLGYAHGSADLFSTQYARDALGRISEATEVVQGESRTWGYRYDDSGRLAEVSLDGASYAAYEYDSNGNRVRVTTPSGVIEGSYDGEDRLLGFGGASYAYTPNGELASRVAGGDTTKYAYDGIGTLRSVRLPDGRTVEYLVDGAHRRVGVRVAGELVRGYLYAGSSTIMAELDGAGQVVSRFVYGTRRNVPDYMIREGRTFRLMTDHQGSVRLVVDAATGETVQRIDYDPWGKVVRDTRPGFQPFGYAGGMYDSLTGLVRFGARDYDPHTGRWTTKDPIAFGGGDTNLYGYVLGDPINFVDPAGLDWLETLANFVAGFGDQMTFGLTDLIRDLIDANGTVNKCSTAYEVGELVEMLGEIAAMGLSAGLKSLLARKGGGKAARRSADRYLQNVPRQAEKRLHHRNPLSGHMGAKGYKDNTTLFPVGGLPDWIHSSGWNLKFVEEALHPAIHLRLRQMEDFLKTAFNPGMLGLRVGAAHLRECPCK